VHEATEDDSVIALPGLVILHLTDRCDNRCAFCMVSAATGRRRDLPLSRVREVVGAQNPGSRVDLFGGEPTLHPEFLEIVRTVAELGHTLSVASNAHTFARPGLAERLVETAGRGKVYVRTSLYGLDGAQHDAVTQHRGSFDRLMEGVRNLVAAGARTQINIVLTRMVIGHLDAMVDLVARLGVDRIKFGGLVDVDGCPEIEPTLHELRSALGPALARARSRGLTITLEKLPMCAAPSFLSSFSTERDVGAWPRTYADEAPCGGCLARRLCDGLDPGYAIRHGSGELCPLHRVRLSAVRALPSEPREVEELEFLKVHLFQVPDDWAQRPDLVDRCRRTVSVVQQRFGRVALVPMSLIEQQAQPPGGDT